MNNINFVTTGGFPFELDDLNFLRDCLNIFGEFAYGIAGTNPVIIKGCEVAGSNVTDGFVIINGELLPFVGGTLGTKVTIVETIGQKTFEDGVARNVYTTRVAQFGVTGTDWSDFKRLNDIAGHLVPPGVIAMWSGAVNAIPSGWKLCDGTNGTPNLKGRFIVGYDSADTDYDDIAKTGGSKKVALAINEMPRHRHGMATEGEGTAGDGVRGRTSDVLTGVTEYTKHAGGDGTQTDGPGEPHENRPPYYVLAYIMKA